ncbi:MAG: FAD-dependent oxidoreductase [Myxococcota bacterium]|nr:FAD-dependent oxidoreductase [Myxococcota bacterium]
MAHPPEAVDTLIIGAGLAGLSTALHHDGEAIIVEATDQVGGKARSRHFEGFTFDVTGHWLHLRDEGVRALVLETCGEEHFAPIVRQSRVWSHGVYTHYPFQANVYGLPPEVVRDCVMGAIEAERARPEIVTEAEEPENFADWIRFYFGEGIARHFMIPYNAKLWGVPAEEITSRWCQRFVPRPQLEQIVAGAVGCNQDRMGYNATFLYPKSGGIQTVAEALADRCGRERIYLNQKVVQIDPIEKIATLEGGRSIRYQRLVSTAPLPVLIDQLDGVPAPVHAARARLRAMEVSYLDVGIRGALGQPDHWIYVPEERWPMYRVGSFSNAMATMAPEGCSSLYIELSDRDTPIETLRPQIEAGLIEMGLIENAEQILFAHAHRIPNAYVIYDQAYPESRATIHSWLSEVGVLSTGRYGDWNYSSMEDALIDGRTAADWLKKTDPTETLTARN